MIQRFSIDFFLFCLVTISSITVSVADEIRPGYLELKEKEHNIFFVLWKVPAKGNKYLSLNAQLPDNCKNQTQADSQLINGAYIQHWVVDCEGGISEKNISISGLELTSTDVLLRLELMDGTSHSVLLTPTIHTYNIPAKPSKWQIIGTYSWLGFMHILLGIDHLLFVFALLIIVKGKRRLIWTITAFTIAHSLTLAGATLGFVYAPQQPVEAVIALSILFLAMEIVHDKRGQTGLAVRAPWMIAFIFGLLHGFGFAGALAEVGLPQSAIPLALVFFNIGVELGQLVFIAAVLLLAWILLRLNRPKLLHYAELVTLYFIGSLSSFWLFERTSAF